MAILECEVSFIHPQSNRASCQDDSTIPSYCFSCITPLVGMLFSTGQGQPRADQAICSHTSTSTAWKRNLLHPSPRSPTLSSTSQVRIDRLPLALPRPVTADFTQSARSSHIAWSGLRLHHVRSLSRCSNFPPSHDLLVLSRSGHAEGGYQILGIVSIGTHPALLELSSSPSHKAKRSFAMLVGSTPLGSYERLKRHSEMDGTPSCPILFERGEM